MILNERTVKNLIGVNPALVKVVKRVGELFNDPNVTFSVTEGLRSIERQKQLVAEGKSQTLKGQHITGHAVDFAIFLNKELTWNIDEYVKLAEIVKIAAKELNVKVKWGGFWVILNDIDGSVKQRLDQYIKERKSQGRSPFIDAPHFEIDPTVYKWKIEG